MQGKVTKLKLRPPPRIIDGVEIDHANFWAYCNGVAVRSKQRALSLKVPHDIDALYVDSLFVSQAYRCAVSDIVLEPAGDLTAFGPSLDRIVPTLGYVKGNVRVVCNIVNFAMNSWGVQPLERLVEAMGQNKNRTSDNMSTPSPQFSFDIIQ